MVDLYLLGRLNDAIELALRIRDAESIRLSGQRGVDHTVLHRSFDLCSTLREAAMYVAQPWLDEHPEVGRPEIRDLVKLVREDQGL